MNTKDKDIYDSKKEKERKKKRRKKAASKQMVYSECHFLKETLFTVILVQAHILDRHA